MRGWLRAASKPIGLWITLGVLLLAAQPVAAKKPKNEDCLACHADATLTKDVDGKQVSLQVEPEHFKNSAHGAVLACVDCHKGVQATVHESTPPKVACAQCHADEQAAYDRSYHAKAIKAGDGKAATCEDCHGSVHALLPADDAKSRVHHANIPATCGGCHGQKFVMEATGHSSQPFVSYQESVHGKAVAAGKTNAAVCTDCHGAHEILAASNPKSPIFKFNVPDTCGKCHQGVEKEFVQSIHGQALTRGNSQAPVCTDCHGIHSIKSHIDPNSSVSAMNLAMTTCARCHEGVRLSEEFGVAGSRSATYLDSYHGLASKGGSKVVANCASCHGVHNILPSSDPRSMISRQNLAKTCGACHPGVNERFALNKVHVDSRVPVDVGSLAVRWVRKIYLGLIFTVIGAMLIHNLILWRFKAVARRKERGPVVVRMNRNQRMQHLVLLVSFIVLVVTGFALKYPDSWFANALGLSERLRSVTHRIAGVAMIAVGIYHLFYIAANRDGRRLVKDLLPGPKDALDALGTLRYHLGLGGRKAQFGRFSYGEKAEYWALVWGAILMAATGVMLWAKVWVGDLLARWWLDVATAIHFYEAVLATLAILVWHFYQVFFDPDVYPMNWAWWDGKMSRHHYEQEHGLDTAPLGDSTAPVGDSPAVPAISPERTLAKPSPPSCLPWEPRD